MTRSSLSTEQDAAWLVSCGLEYCLRLLSSLSWMSVLSGTWQPAWIGQQVWFCDIFLFDKDFVMLIFRSLTCIKCCSNDWPLLDLGLVTAITILSLQCTHLIVFNLLIFVCFGFVSQSLSFVTDFQWIIVSVHSQRNGEERRGQQNQTPSGKQVRV